MGLGKVILVLGIVSLMAILLSDWGGGPSIGNAWTGFSSTLASDPYAGIPEWPVFTAPSAPSAGSACDWWDLSCWASGAASSVAYATAYIGAAFTYVGQILFTTGQYIFAFLSHFFAVAGAFSSALIGTVTAPMSFFTGDGIYVGIVLFVPLLVIVMWYLLTLIRGNE